MLFGDVLLSTIFPTPRQEAHHKNMGNAGNTIIGALVCGAVTTVVGSEIAETMECGVKCTVLTAVGCGGVGIAIGEQIGRVLDSRYIYKETRIDNYPS